MSDDAKGITIRFGNNLSTWLSVLLSAGSLIAAIFFSGSAIGANRRLLDMPEELTKTRASLEFKIQQSDEKNATSFKELGQAIDSIKDRLKSLEFNVTGTNGLLERFGQLSGRVEANITSDFEQDKRIRELEILINQPRK